MRKSKMITRTIVTTKAEIMAFNLDTNEVITLNESYIGDLSDKEIEKQFAIDYENYAKFLDFFRFPCYVNLEAEKFRTTTPMYPAEIMDKCELKNDLGDFLETYYNYWEKIRISN